MVLYKISVFPSIGALRWLSLEKLQLQGKVVRIIIVIIADLSFYKRWPQDPLYPNHMRPNIYISYNETRRKLEIALSRSSTGNVINLHMTLNTPIEMEIKIKWYKWRFHGIWDLSSYCLMFSICCNRENGFF